VVAEEVFRSRRDPETPAAACLGGGSWKDLAVRTRSASGRLAPDQPEETEMSSALDGSKRREREVVEARRRAGLVAAVAGLVLVPWFLVIDPLAGFRPESPPVGAPAQDFVDFYVDNFSRIPLNTTLFIGQWVILLVLLVPSSVLPAGAWTWLPSLPPRWPVPQRPSMWVPRASVSGLSWRPPT
jgi:hypothetical protein